MLTSRFGPTLKMEAFSGRACFVATAAVLVIRLGPNGVFTITMTSAASTTQVDVEPAGPILPVNPLVGCHWSDGYQAYSG